MKFLVNKWPSFRSKVNVIDFFNLLVKDKVAIEQEINAGLEWDKDARKITSKNYLA